MVRKSYGNVANIKRERLTARLTATQVEMQQNESFCTHELRGLRIVLSDWSALMLVCTPVGLFWPNLTEEWVFIINWLAIIPQASIVFTSIEIIGEHLGVRWGGIFDAFVGKAVEQTMCVQCMRAGLIQVLQGNLMGSLHWNLLLVLGMAIFVSGIQRTSNHFKPDGASAQMSCQIVASIAIALPTMFRTISSNLTDETVLKLSRIIAVATLCVYFLFLWFHFVTHLDAFDSHVGETQRQKKNDSKGGHDESLAAALAQAKGGGSFTDEAAVLPILSLFNAFLVFCLSIFLCGWSSQLLVNSIPIVSDKYGIPKAFIGVTLLPIIGNTAEHLAALTCALRGEMDLVIDIAVGSATQIALFVIPGAVMWGWMFDMPFTMDFRNFDATVMLLSTFLVAQVLQGGYTNWLHGAMLMTTYTLIAIISWFIPE